MGWISMLLSPEFPGPKKNNNDISWDAFIIENIEIKATTQKAYLVKQGATEQWLPISHVKLIKDHTALKIPRWLYQQKNFIGKLSTIQHGRW